jgi:hypothetical protein
MGDDVAFEAWDGRWGLAVRASYILWHAALISRLAYIALVRRSVAQVLAFALVAVLIAFTLGRPLAGGSFFACASGCVASVSVAYL